MSRKSAGTFRTTQYILEAIDENLLTTIQFVADSWRAVKISTIQNCFATCRFKSSERPDILNDEEDLSTAGAVNTEEFSTIDDYLLCYDENEDCEDAIIDRIKSRNQENNNEDVEDGADDDPPVSVTNHEARKYITGLQRYFMQEGNEKSPMSALNICANFVEIQSYKKRQSTLDVFLHI
ncbi:hypothetical protein ABEB36_014700 [Hypothenemus hampei]|uniref:DDE-1 domain-containing protein n=1 Tax=Hypothenemus hampei TaxID=57062 RepID=A0ABD1E2L2_HYPHA